MRAALAEGADPNSRSADFNLTAVESVCFSKLMLDLDEDEFTTRQLAALRLLAEYGGLDAAAATAALSHAVEYRCSPAVVQALLDGGADVRHVDCGGRTPLHYARRPDVVQLLAAAGGDVNAADSTAFRPLHMCTREGTEHTRQSVTALIAAGAHVNAVTACGATCLTFAAEASSGGSTVDETVKVLLEAGADPTIANEDGMTPVVLAMWQTKAILANDPDDVALLADNRAVITHLARAEAWWRRRHLLLVVRGRYGAATANGHSGAAAGSSRPAASGSLGASKLSAVAGSASWTHRQHSPC